MRGRLLTCKIIVSAVRVRWVRALELGVYALMYALDVGVERKERTR